MTPLDEILSEIEARLAAATPVTYHSGNADLELEANTQVIKPYYDDISRLLKACRILALACDKIRGNPQRAATWTAAEALTDATKALTENKP